MTSMFQSLIHMDHHVFRVVNQNWSSPVLDKAMPFITDLNLKLLHPNGLLIALALLVLWLWWFRGRAVRALIAALLALGLADTSSSFLIKPYVHRLRPEHVGVGAIVRTPYAHSGFSFPSNHSTNSFAVASTLGSYFPGARLLLLGYAAAVAYSRVYCGVHFPLDVFAGAILGLLWSYLILYIMNRVEHRWFVYQRMREEIARDKRRMDLNQPSA